MKRKFPELPDLPPLPEFIKNDNGGCPYGKYEFTSRSSPEISSFISEHEGPTSESNWLIPSSVLLSGYPFAQNLISGKKKLRKLIDAGIDVFVQLQTKLELSRFTRYEEHALKMNPDCTFNNNCEILDMNSPKSKTDVYNLSKYIQDKILKKKKILIHCWGGHGRSGTIACCLLSDLYPGLMLSEIFKRVQSTHDCRVASRSRAPQNSAQFQFVADYVGKSRNDEKDFPSK